MVQFFHDGQFQHQEALQPDVLLRRQDVEGRLNISRSTLYAKLNLKDGGYDPSFPVPIRIGANAVRWRRSEIDAYIASLPRTREIDAMAGVQS